MSLGSESLLGRVELEGPEEVVGFLEVSANSGDLVDQILNRGNAVLSEGTLNDGVVGQGNSGAVDLAVSSLVDKLSDCGLRGVAICNVGLNSSDHVDGGLVETNKHTVVELSQTEELQDLSAGGVKLVDTSGSNDKGNLSLRLNEEVASVLGFSSSVNK